MLSQFNKFIKCSQYEFLKLHLHNDASTFDTVPAQFLQLFSSIKFVYDLFLKSFAQSLQIRLVSLLYDLFDMSEFLGLPAYRLSILSSEVS